MINYIKYIFSFRVLAFSLTIYFALSSCTYGTVSDSREDRMLEILMLKNLLDQLPAYWNTEIRFRDGDTIDNRSFEAQSDSQIYTVDLSEGTASIDRVELWISPPDDTLPDPEDIGYSSRKGPFSAYGSDNSSVEALHNSAEPVTVETDDEKYTSPYLTLEGTKYSLLDYYGSTGFNTDFGSLPRGTVLRLTMHLNDLYLAGKATRNSDSSWFDFAVHTGETDIILDPLCEDAITAGETHLIDSELRIADIFAEDGNGLILSEMHLTGENPVNINPYQNETILTSILASLERSGTFRESLCTQISL